MGVGVAISTRGVPIGCAIVDLAAVGVCVGAGVSVGAGGGVLVGTAELLTEVVALTLAAPVATEVGVDTRWLITSSDELWVNGVVSTFSSPQQITLPSCRRPQV